jgi:glycosyltransferase involved in cell wall biosynthesis
MASNYWCCIITRDGAQTLGATIDSILAQDLPPQFMVVVNDGSTDDTQGIINDKSKNSANIFSVQTGSKTRDIRRVPVLLNLGLEFARKMPKTNYMMVSGDDNDLSSSYAGSIISRMEKDPSIVVASGEWIDSPGRSNQMPHGGGRLVRMEFMEKLNGRYPIAYGWETWLLYKAMELGYKVKIFPDQRYQHLRPFQSKNLLGWGRAMYSLGFPSYFVLLRFIINFVWSRRGAQNRGATVSMLAGYLSAKLDPQSLRSMIIQDESLKSFVRRYCATRLTSVL